MLWLRLIDSQVLISDEGAIDDAFAMILMLMPKFVLPIYRFLILACGRALCHSLEKNT